MATRKKTAAPELSREEKIAKLKAEFGKNGFNHTDAAMIATPDREFKVGDKVQVGHLHNCVVADVFLDGKAIVVDYFRTDREGTFPGIGVWWWFECIWDPETTAPKFTRVPYRGQVSTSSIDSLLHMYSHDGLACNPEYQRGYVWTQADQEALFDSIFARMTIGSFVFVRNHGYLHKGKVGTKRYISMDGKVVDIPLENNYTVEVIDGQQRATTIIRFLTGQITYRGYTFHQLNRTDRNELLGTQFTYRLINEEDVERKELLELFLQVNRGVPQDPSHLAKVQALYDAMP